MGFKGTTTIWTVRSNMAQGILTGIVIVSVLAFICQGLSFSMPGWIRYVKTGTNNTETYEGLWMICPTGWGSCENGLANRTITVHNASDIVMWVTQAYGVLGIILAIVACLCGFCCEGSPAGVASSVFNFGAGFSILIGLVTYGVRYEEVYRVQPDIISASLFYCFWLSLVASVLSLFCALLGLCSTDRYYKYKE